MTCEIPGTSRPELTFYCIPWRTLYQTLYERTAVGNIATAVQITQL